jgi:protein O-GlcNAc transferase
MNGRAIVAGLVALASLADAQRPSGLEAAWRMLANGQRGQAVTLLREIVHDTPRNADAHLMLGSILMEDGDRAESIAQLTTAVKLLPQSAEAHNALGEAYKAFDDPKDAIPEFERAVQIDPGHAQAHANMAAILMEEGDEKSAVPHLERAIRLFGKKPDAAYPHYLRAKVYQSERETEKAVAELGQAVELRPDFAEAWSDLGEARRDLNDDAGALRAFRRAVELNPEDGVAQARLGSALLDSGVAHDAATHLKEAVRLDPKNQSALNALQLALRRDGQSEQAEAVKRQLTEVMRERDKADQSQVAAIELNNQGAALEKNGDVRGAVAKYRSALTLLPEHVGIRTNLAVALLKVGSWDEGLAELREALRRDPNNANLIAALKDALAQYENYRKRLPKP